MINKIKCFSEESLNMEKNVAEKIMIEVMALQCMHSSCRGTEASEVHGNVLGF
jgi:hypothetical protein